MKIEIFIYLIYTIFACAKCDQYQNWQIWIEKYTKSEIKWTGCTVFFFNSCGYTLHAFFEIYTYGYTLTDLWMACAV